MHEEEISCFLLVNNIEFTKLYLALFSHTFKGVSSNCAGIHFSISNGVDNCIVCAPKLQASEVIVRINAASS
ncbi:hypothetical protein ES708_21826 [subsurface metagenome]